jgi:hypothetical protein
VSGTVVNELQKVGSNEVAVEDRHRDAILYTRRSWRDAVETLGVMQEAALAGFETNFSESIAPLTIQTMMALFGDASLQFRFVSGMTNPVAVAYRVTFDNDTDVLTAPAAVIQHMTMGIDDAAPSHADNEYRFWQLAEFNSPPLEGEKKYYLYAKVDRTGTTGVFYLSETAIGMYSDSSCYYLWVGFLNSAFEGVRADFVTVYGFTEILPGQITVDRIRDSLGRLVIDLANAEITGKVTFTNGSSGYENLSDKPDLSVYDDAVNFIDNVLPDDLARLQNQIDDNIESWFYHYDPSLTNIPASDWTTTELREAHLDDTFTNLDTGQSWRFTKDGSVYGWTLLADSAATKALVLAGQAKDTADGKRRVFVAQPYPPYDVGDLWVQGSAGDIMRCQTGRLSGSYVASDWVKASKYTDDTAALAAVAAAVDDLNTYLSGAFHDGIISETEAVSIEMYLNVLAAEKANVDAGYTALYGNSLLTGTAKSRLYSAKSTLDTRYTSLVNAINSSIADGKVTNSERLAVDTCYANYKTALSTYSTRHEEAYAAINSSIDGRASDALSAAEAAGSTASGKATVYYNTSTSYFPSGLKANDLLCTGTEIYRYDGSSWVLVSAFYNTKTVINGGLISTGALIVGTSESTGQGGIAGGGTVRLWSGGTVTSGVSAPNSATFMVDKDGVVSSKNSFIVYDANGLSAAGFTSGGASWGSTPSATDDLLQNPGSLRMWVGGEYGSISNSHFKVYMSGVVQASGLILSNTTNPTSTDAAGIFSTYNALKLNQTNVRCKSGGGGNSTVINSDMQDSTLKPYVEIVRQTSGSGNPAVSIDARGGTACMLKGGIFHFDDPIVDADSSILIGKSTVFLFTGSSARTRYLPSSANLESLLYGDYAWARSIEITVVQHTGSTGSTVIKGVTDGYLHDNSGGYMGGTSPGQMTLTRGHCAVFRYLRGGWYIMSLRS